MDDNGVNMLMRIATVLDADEEEISPVSAGMKEIILAIRRYCRHQIEMNAERRRAAFNKMYPPIPYCTGDTEETEECSICIHPIQHYRNISCGHKFCTECLDRWYIKRNTCPICKKNLD